VTETPSELLKRQLVARNMKMCHICHTNYKKIYNPNSGLAVQGNTRIPEQWQGGMKENRKADRGVNVRYRRNAPVLLCNIFKPPVRC
jgi:hypothetical protein